VDLEEMGCSKVNLIDLAHWQVFVFVVLNLWVWQQRISQVMLIPFYTVDHSNTVTGVSVFCLAFVAGRHSLSLR
jgi:hypothetical protein